MAREKNRTADRAGSRQDCQAEEEGALILVRRDVRRCGGRTSYGHHHALCCVRWQPASGAGFRPALASAAAVAAAVARRRRSRPRRLENVARFARPSRSRIVRGDINERRRIPKRRMTASSTRAAARSTSCGGHCRRRRPAGAAHRAVDTLTIMERRGSSPPGCARLRIRRVSRRSSRARRFVAAGAGASRCGDMPRRVRGATAVWRACAGQQIRLAGGSCLHVVG